MSRWIVVPLLLLLLLNQIQGFHLPVRSWRRPPAALQRRRQRHLLLVRFPPSLLSLLSSTPRQAEKEKEEEEEEEEEDKDKRQSLAAAAATANDKISLPPPSGMHQVTRDVQDLYRDLDAPGLVSVACTDTIRFSFVAPPSACCVAPPQSGKKYAWQDQQLSDPAGFYKTDTNLPPVSWLVDSLQNRPEAFCRVAASHNHSSKVLAIYLPGLDGSGISAVAQFDDLAQAFELWRLVIDVENGTSTSLHQLVQHVAQFVRDALLASSDSPRPVVLIGESFGGLLAPLVLLQLRTLMKQQHNNNDNHHPIAAPADYEGGLVLVNPATSFSQSPWGTLVPLLSSLQHWPVPEPWPTPYSVLGSLTLMAAVPDGRQYPRILDRILQSSSSISNLENVRDAWESIQKGFGLAETRLPPQTIQHRVTQWLQVGCDILQRNDNHRWKELANVSTLILAGADDKLLPSANEATRLGQLLPNCTKRIIFPRVGHFLLDDTVNLTQILWRQSPTLFPHKKRYNAITDWTLPSQAVIDQALRDQIEPARTLTSPIFLSTDEHGRRRRGLSSVPTTESVQGPVLLVGNHQFAGLDLGMIVAQLLQDRGISVRGLAHPIVFGQALVNSTTDTNLGGGGGAGNAKGAGVGFGSVSLFETFGAVPVTPKNYYRLLQTGQCVLLYPGGVREVFHGKKEAHQLFWPSKADFVRTAARFNATIVTLSGVGAADSATILVDAPDMQKIPGVWGEQSRNFTSRIRAARFDATVESELFQPPLALPKPLPARHYFLFGQPMSTTHLDPQDRKACAEFYSKVKAQLEQGLQDLLYARTKDPFADTAKRLAYESFWKKQAPTFDIAEMNLS